MLGVIFLFLGIIIFLFFFWKRLKEDYSSERIFSTAFYILFGIGAGFLAVWFFKYQQFWFWASSLGFISGFLLGNYKFELQFFESLEAASIGVLFLLGLIFLADSITFSNTFSLAGFGVIFLLIGFWFFLESKYKNFSWYKSGRVGFSGLLVAGLFFLIRAGVATAFPTVLSFVGGVEGIVSGIVAFSFFLGLYNLSRV